MSNNIDDKELRQLLKLTTKPQSDPLFTDKIMMGIAKVNHQQLVIRRYKRLSWIFIMVAIVISIKVVDQLDSILLSMNMYLNPILPGLSQILTYIIMLCLAGIILFSINLLLINREGKNEASPMPDMGF